MSTLFVFLPVQASPDTRCIHYNTLIFRTQVQVPIYDEIVVRIAIILFYEIK